MTRRRIIRAAMVVLLVALGLAYGVRATAGEPVRGHLGGFRLIVETDRRDYGPGEPVEMRVTICRSRPWPVRTSAGGGTDVPTKLRVLDARGDVVADTTHEVRTTELRHVGWLPGMCRTARTEWDQRYWNREDPWAEDRAGFGAPVRGERVQAGPYRVQAEWLSAKGGGPPVALEPAMSPPFTIEP